MDWDRVKQNVRRAWPVAVGLMGYLGQFYNEEIKAFQSQLSLPQTAFDPIPAIFAFLMILGGAVFVWNEVSRLRKKRYPIVSIEGLIDRTVNGGKFWAIGYHHGMWTERLGEEIMHAITKRQVEFTFLIADPTTENFNQAIASELIDSGAVGTNTASRTRLHELRAALGKDQDKLKVRLFDLPLAYSMVIVNPYLMGALMEAQVWPHMYKVGYEYRHRTVLFKKGSIEPDDPKKMDMFDRCVHSFEYVCDKKSWEDERPTPQPSGGAQVKGAELDELTLESDVNWHLSADIQPSPPFGSQDMPGSDKASKLHFTQHGVSFTLTGDMKCLKPSYLYYVQIGKPYTPMKRAMDSIIGDQKAAYATFPTDENGEGTWRISLRINDLTRHGIIDRFAVWVNDAPKNVSVLGSDNIMLRLTSQ